MVLGELLFSINLVLERGCFWSSTFVFSVDITLDETVGRVAGRNECEEGGEGKSEGLPTEIDILLVLKRWASRAIDHFPILFK